MNCIKQFQSLVIFSSNFMYLGLLVVIVLLDICLFIFISN